MKIFLLLAIISCAFAKPPQLSDAGAVNNAHKQMHINQLLCKINEKIQSKYSELKDASTNFNPESDGSLYTDGGVAVHHLSQEVRDQRVLEQHHWFSLFNNRHREESLMLFETLVYAKTWNTFANTAAYYRERVNEGVFVYAFYTALIHSDHGRDVILPPLYEVTPHMFTNSEIIHQAYSSKMKQIPGKFRMSFTGTKKNPEQRVAYFGEDIGLNVHHVTWHMDYPFWWKDSYGYHLDRKGELFFWVHHQLTARFDAERLSNNLNVVDELHWDRKIHEGFAPHTTYKYGGEFPARPDNIRFDDVDGVARIRDMMVYEDRVRDAIARGYVTARDGSTINIRNEHGIEVLGDIVESSEQSANTDYYGALHNLAHIMLGRQGDPHGKFAQPPGVMEHFETATRDPAFFRLHKYMDNIFKEHKDSLTPYTAEDIGFPGIEVEKMEVSRKLETFFEDFEFGVGNGVDGSENVKEVDLVAIVSRLNHVPFNVKFDVTSNNDEDVLATFRVYLCPSNDANGIHYTWESGRWGCIEYDKFWKKLHQGENHVERASVDASTTVPDRPSFKTILELTKKSVDSNKDLDLSKFSRSCGIPNRLLLPKGKMGGMDFDLVVFVTDGKKDGVIDGMVDNEHGGSHTQCGIHGETYPETRPLGFPLDRHIPDDRVFKHSHNIRKERVTIYHRD